MLHNTVWIGFKRDSLQHLSVEYPVDPRDKILMTIERGDKEGILFMGGFAIERMRIIFELQKTRLREMEKLDAPP